jgi:hypothetical protein
MMLKKVREPNGIDPSWVGLAATVPADRLRILSRDEIDRFRIDGRDAGGLR